MSYIGNPIVSTDFPVDYFSGNGSTTAFTLSIAPASVNAVDVEVSGVSQSPQTYTISGTTLTFSAAPPSGSSNIVIKHRGIAGVPNVPSASSVTTSSIAANAVTSAKLANSGAELGMRNRIINGAMVIDQRNAGASTSPTGTYTLDRWYVLASQSSKFTVQQNAGSVTPPAGFSNYLGITSSSAYSILSSDYFLLDQYIEGFNTADLAFGTANAKTVTLSFWVRSSLTGTFGGVLQNSAVDRSYVFSYSISSANTWEQKSITITGDTTGTWVGATNGIGMRVRFSFGMGSTYTNTANSWYAGNYDAPTGQTSVVGTNGATFYITGIQLEVGSSATSFDYRQYTNEFELCQRYYQKAPITYGAAINTTTLGTCYDFPVVMRATPTLALLTTTPYAEIPLTTGYTASGATIAGYSYAGGTGLTVTGFSGFTSGRAPILLDNNQVSVSAEL